MSFEDLGGKLLILTIKWLHPSHALLNISEFTKILEVLVVEHLIDTLRDLQLKTKLREVEASNCKK